MDVTPRKSRKESSSSSEDEFELADPVTPPERRVGDDSSLVARPRASTASGAAGGGSPGSAKLPLSIRTLDGKTFKIEARTDWTVLKLKQEFEEWRGPGSASCMFIYKAKRLDDKQPLSAYKIEPHSFIQANFRSTGGLLGGRGVF